jgi:hypothetical protein
MEFSFPVGPRVGQSRVTVAWSEERRVAMYYFLVLNSGILARYTTDGVP